jgi:5-methylcytosine-specific restriction endonuclease McrA
MSENQRIRRSEEYREWRRCVFERDDYRCVRCGQRGGMLNAHHVKPFSAHPELRFDVANGETLCLTCHEQTDTYLFKAVKGKRAQS